MNEPELFLFNGRIYPRPGAEVASAFLVRRGRIASMGGAAEEEARRGGRAERVDLAGATVTAGFTDSHVHLTARALARRRISLVGVTSVAEAVRQVAQRAATGSGWLLGHGWNRHLLDRSPTAGDLDAVASDRPVLLDSQDLHSAWLNTAALRLCEIDSDTPDPPAGRIERDPETGDATGVLFENARALALARVAEPSEEEISAALLETQAEAHRLGITAVHSVEVAGLRDFKRLAERDRLRLRVLQHVQLDQLDGAIAEGLRSGLGDDWVRVGGVKMFLDGSLGSRTAWLREPYVGYDGDTGVRVLTAKTFESAVRRAADHGLASTVHAIGDAAVEEALRVLSAVPPPSALPHRIEHVQLCPPDLWDRFGRSGIVASMQPVHLLTETETAERYWGRERSRGAYPFAALLRAGAVLAFGSDTPVETMDPRPGLYAATGRGDMASYRAGSSVQPWFPEHLISPAAAVSAYTEGPAYAAGWSRRGRLLPGYDADLVAWSLDPVAARPDDFARMECLLTVVGGEIVHRRGL